MFYRSLTNDKIARVLWNQPSATTYALPFLDCSGLLNLKFWPKNTNQVIESQKFWPNWVTELTKLSHRKTSKFPLYVINCKLRGATEIVSDKVFTAHKDGLKCSSQGKHMGEPWMCPILVVKCQVLGYNRILCFNVGGCYKTNIWGLYYARDSFLRLANYSVIS